MATEITPRDLQEQAQRGVKRTKNFRKARLMFLREFVGSYYDRATGSVGEKPLNLMFNSINTIVPNLVMNFPEFNVASDWVVYRDYGEMLGLALDYDTKKKDLRTLYRRWIVDALFTLGTVKTGIGDSGTTLHFDDWGTSYDPGTVYTELVDFDDLVIDPAATSLDMAAFLGDKIRVPRQSLLDSGLYNNELIEKLPPSDGEPSRKTEARHISNDMKDVGPISKFTDEVEVIELWIRSTNTVVTIPSDDDLKFDEFLRVEDYYGPNCKTGPYTFLQFGVPVPNNPIHAFPVSQWYDLHILANRLAKKTIDQAERQKTLVGFRRSAADDAQEALDASDGEAVAMEDPDGVREYNFGGQTESNQGMVGQLQAWFRAMSANPVGLGGGQDPDSATEAQILGQTANVAMNDLKDQVYIAVGAEAAKRAWFFHTDPLIEVPLVRRKTQPAQMDPMTGQMQPAQMEDVQEVLTPEAREGDWLDFSFDVQPESMGRIDSEVRLRQAMDFAAKILPAAVQAAQSMAMLGQPFSIPKFIIRLGKEAGLTWLDEVFYDPEFQQNMAQMMMAGPGPEGSQASMGQPTGAGGFGGAGGTGAGGLAAFAQNGQPANLTDIPSAGKDQRQQQQQTAAFGQRDQAVRPLS